MQAIAAGVIEKQLATKKEIEELTDQLFISPRMKPLLLVYRGRSSLGTTRTWPPVASYTKLNHLQYLTPIGEYVIPIAALILALVVWYWDDLRIAARLINRLIQWIRA